MRAVVTVLLLALAACSPPAPPAAPEPAEERAPTVADAQSPDNGCPAYVYTEWHGAPDVKFGLEAWGVGANCAEAKIILNIMDANAYVHTAILDVSEMEPLAGAQSVNDLQTRMMAWLVPAGASMDSTGDLAVWEQGAPEPSYAMVAFHPAPNITREIYEALRAADAPMYCYQQNNESGVCLTLQDGVLEPIGVQDYAG